MPSLTLAQLAEQLSVELIGDGQHVVSATASIDDAQHHQATFFNDKKYLASLENTLAGVVVLKPEYADSFAGNKLLSNNPYLTYALIAQLLDTTPNLSCGIHPTAVINDGATVADSANIGPYAVVEKGAQVAEKCQIGAGTVIGENAKVGAGSKIYPNVTIYHGVEIGQNCIIHSGAVVGSDGFGFANDNARWVKIPQVGTVIIGDHVEIGANTSIDRGALHNTVIADGVKIDNLVHLAHNVELGENTAIAANTAIAGSTKVGQRCTFAGCVAVNGHIEIGDDVHFTGTSMVTSSFKDAGVYSSGIPAVANKEWRKNTARVRKIETLFDKVKLLEKEIARLMDDDK
ncbi:UDP-3-O-(3-hydroxymyristoyl) glucosamine N-acyltransferase [Catenovulum agarivorans DS-2]|uniref:UDP-3-O-acylglucosamine N-acyltransferase n=1 Tax=Catenovulum agarivorans DS-2 TaxID=1328313 RepID=W7QEJ3_9ALTE|nr:UDP-3-O-(3-hydroxymyristoyl)glucosamine N-acyltransferase [Catenovulum agarivorans]EWH11309.1 UDP-3-O-(3-hydroxymyristoyl) glucosamine N-acyltransferase [Catenovulum agarivorans DS-2]